MGLATAGFICTPGPLIGTVPRKIDLEGLVLPVLDITPGCTADGVVCYSYWDILHMRELSRMFDSGRRRRPLAMVSVANMGANPAVAYNLVYVLRSTNIQIEAG